jgi:hypothetical protein
LVIQVGTGLLIKAWCAPYASHRNDIAWCGALTKENIMNAMAKLSTVAALVVGLNATLLAGDLDSAVAYSMGEFDRVGLSQPLPKTLSGEVQRKATSSRVQSSQNRQLNAQKAEFVRRMFWMALSMR